MLNNNTISWGHVLLKIRKEGDNVFTKWKFWTYKLNFYIRKCVTWVAEEHVKTSTSYHISSPTIYLHYKTTNFEGLPWRFLKLSSHTQKPN